MDSARSAQARGGEPPSVSVASSSTQTPQNMNNNTTNNTSNNTSNNTMSSSSRPAYATLSMATTTPGPSIGLPHDCSLSDPDLRLLVLDYCVHAGYLDTAKALLATPRSDDHVPEDPAACDDTPMAGQDQPQLEDHRELLHDMKQRKHVVSLIEQGKIADALHLLSVLCPKIVHLPAKVQPESNTLLHTRPLKRSKTASPADDIDMPEWQPTKAAFDRAKQPTCPDACPNTLKSDANRIIGLDLRIQAFIELMRTSNQRGSFLSPSDSDYASDQDNKALVLGLPLYNLAWASILTLGQTLFALTAALDIPPNIASAYQAELNHASELFLYANPDDAPEISHVRELLQFDRRRELAQRVNSAMLEHKGRMGTSALETMVTHTTATWHMLNEAKVSFTVNNAEAQASGGKPNEKTKIRAPIFSLRRFLDDPTATTSETPPE